MEKLLDGNLLSPNLRGYKILLASGSPRRKGLLNGLGLKFDIRCNQNIDESYPDNISANEVAAYVSRKKAEAYRSNLADNELLITADTVVVCEKSVLGKPENREKAQEMLQLLSGKTHHVITCVTIITTKKQTSFSVTTDVKFKELSSDEINYYIDNYKPYDKAGAYGIQEWIGYVAVENISGSYYNVMGLPIQRLYLELKNW